MIISKTVTNSSMYLVLCTPVSRRGASACQTSGNHSVRSSAWGPKRQPRQRHIAKTPSHAMSISYHIVSYRVVMLLSSVNVVWFRGCDLVLRPFHTARLSQRGQGVVDLRCHGQHRVYRASPALREGGIQQSLKVVLHIINNSIQNPR